METVDFTTTRMMIMMMIHQFAFLLFNRSHFFLFYLGISRFSCSKNKDCSIVDGGKMFLPGQVHRKDDHRARKSGTKEIFSDALVTMIRARDKINGWMRKGAVQIGLGKRKANLINTYTNIQMCLHNLNIQIRKNRRGSKREREKNQIILAILVMLQDDCGRLCARESKTSETPARGKYLVQGKNEK